MDEIQDRFVRIGLDILAEYGFVLAGGYALQAHQLVDRMSEDVDLFTDRWDSDEFGRAVEAVSKAYRRDGLEVTVVRQAETFARLQVIDPRSGKVGTVDLAADFRDREPVSLSVGPVLAEHDAVASKVATVFSRGKARDYLDLAGILESGRFSRAQLMTLPPASTPGSAEAGSPKPLPAWTGSPTRSSAGYGVDLDRIRRVRERCVIGARTSGERWQLRKTPATS